MEPWLTVGFATLFQQIVLVYQMVVLCLCHQQNFFVWYVKHVDCVVCLFLWVLSNILYTWRWLFLQTGALTDWRWAESVGFAAISGFKLVCWAITRSITSTCRITLYSCCRYLPFTHIHRWGADWWSTGHGDVWSHTVGTL